MEVEIYEEGMWGCWRDEGMDCVVINLWSVSSNLPSYTLQYGAGAGTRATVSLLCQKQDPLRLCRGGMRGVSTRLEEEEGTGFFPWTSWTGEHPPAMRLYPGHSTSFLGRLLNSVCSFSSTCKPALLCFTQKIQQQLICTPASEIWVSAQQDHSTKPEF